MQEGNAESKSKCHSHSFKLSELKGTYVVRGITGGGPGPNSSVSVGTLEITDKKGNGNFPFLTIRSNTGTLPSVITQIPSAQFPNPLPIKISINSNGVGELLTFGLPTSEDITQNSIVFEKINGIVTGAVFIKQALSAQAQIQMMQTKLNFFKW